jgi:dipeptidyl aminopeptidase/acylaminoacyl peptidase
MKSDVKKSVIPFFILIGILVSWVTFAEALDVKLLWKKEFRYKVKSIDFATDSGDVLVALKGKDEGVGKELILFDKGGNERFHWGPRMDRRVGPITISKDGKYFGFVTGYTESYADKKGVHVGSDDKFHFYDRQTKKEVWNLDEVSGGSPRIFPDGSSVIVYGYESGMFWIYNQQGKIIFKQDQQTGGIEYFEISPDSSHFAFVKENNGLLILYKRDGAKLWEKGRHEKGVASITDGASYISTNPYFLGPSDTADSINSHNGTVYDKTGNKVMEGLGVLSGNGSRIAMFYPDKVTVLNWPGKSMVKEIMIDMRELFETSTKSHTRFSYDGKYLFLKSGKSIVAYDLLENTKNEITVPEMVEYPQFYITEDGRYLLTNPQGPEATKILYLYQVY